MSEKQLPVWYEKGLSFKCTGCGKCCGKEPGFVWLTEEDIKKASSYLNLSRTDFLNKYARYVSGRYSLIEKPNYDCVFLKENRCTIYTSRPKQCREFPFWNDNISSKEAWEEASIHCEGINHPLLKLRLGENRLLNRYLFFTSHFS
jgi:Fe-S-cluster containining protein